MKRNLLRLSGLVFLTLVTVGLLIINNTSKAQKTPVALQGNGPSAGSLPVVDWNTELRAQADAVRVRRNAKYDTREAGANPADFVFSEQSPLELTVFPDPGTPAEPAFPVSQSDAIVVGNVTSAAAHLSNDRTHVYSEYAVTVIKKFKGDQVQENSAITIERAGGRIKLPSGRMLIRRGIDGKNFPSLNSVYIFFLRQNKDADDFNIVTAYEVKGDVIYPLDRSPQQSQPLSYLANFDKYYGKKKRAFWADLDRELKLNAATPRRVEVGAKK